MKLRSFRILDRVQLSDMIEVGLVDESWLGKVDAESGLRLRELMDSPE
jgi:hypothetical protein